MSLDWDTRLWPLQMNSAGSSLVCPVWPGISRDTSHKDVWRWSVGTAVSSEVSHASFRSLVPTLAEMEQQCPCSHRGEKKRLMNQTVWEMSWLSHLYRLVLPGKNVVSKYANSSSHSPDCFSSSEFSIICSLSKQSPKCVHVLIPVHFLRLLPTHLPLPSQSGHSSSCRAHPGCWTDLDNKHYGRRSIHTYNSISMFMLQGAQRFALRPAAMSRNT